MPLDILADLVPFLLCPIVDVFAQVLDNLLALSQFLESLFRLPDKGID